MESSSAVAVGEEEKEQKNVVVRRGSIVGSTVSFLELSYFVDAPAPNQGCCRKAPKQILHGIRLIYTIQLSFISVHLAHPITVSANNCFLPMFIG